MVSDLKCFRSNAIHRQLIEIFKVDISTTEFRVLGLDRKGNKIFLYTKRHLATNQRWYSLERKKFATSSFGSFFRDFGPKLFSKCCMKTGICICGEIMGMPGKYFPQIFFYSHNKKTQYLLYNCCYDANQYNNRNRIIW